MSAVIVVRSQCRYTVFCRFAAANRSVGELIALRAAHEVTVLEPGSIPMHTWIIRVDSLQAAADIFSSLEGLEALAESGQAPLVLAASCVPEDGYPEEMSFIPTHKNVDPGDAQPATLMLIEGSASDQDRMDRYRDLILPLMRDCGAYYICFELGGDVQVLSGHWDESIFAISRWPGVYATQQFWLGDEYQRDAIPLRLGIGRFEVVTLEAQVGVI